jgi:hypothetical protein
VELVLPDRCLAFFVDDSGHEELLPDQPVWCLGGCAVLGRDLDAMIVQPWRAIRNLVTGSPDTPLHAHKFPKIANSDGMEAVAEFFRVRPFFRFGAILSVDTQILYDVTQLRMLETLDPSRLSEVVQRNFPTMRMVLEKGINEIVQQTLCKEVKVIFESSQRVDKLIEAAFQSLAVRRGSKHIPSESYFMPKSAGDCALEVADFVMHAVGRQGRQNLKDRSKYLPDFKVIFHSVDRRLTSFIDVASFSETDQRPDSSSPHTNASRQPDIIGPALTHVFHAAGARQQQVAQTWVAISHKVGGRLPNSLLMYSIQRDADVDLLLRSIEDEMARRDVNAHQQGPFFVSKYQELMSTYWIGSVYETFRLLNSRGLADQDPRFDEIHNDLRLLRITLEKHEVAKDRKAKTPVQFTRYPPRNGPSDSYTYDRDDDQRSHIMVSRLNPSGSYAWLALDLENKSERWIERRGLSDRIIELWKDT